MSRLMPTYSPAEEELPLGFSDISALAPAKTRSPTEQNRILGTFPWLPKPLMLGGSVPSPQPAIGPRVSLATC